MSGHSKWATIKHQKGAKDARRGKLFARLIRAIEVAAREGGSDQTSNATLRTMYAKARDASVPIDTIDRAVPMWLEVTTGELKATVRDLPLREQIDVPVREQLIVELYSK